MELRAVGVVRSPLTARKDAPRQPDEGAPAASVEVDPTYAAALEGVAAGDVLELLTWLHGADRETLRVHPRSDPDRPVQGVFATRSPDRPNPIGLHRVTVVAVEGTTLRVDALEAIDGTPVIDLKPLLRSER
jgi:tRNA-Thr(GGU) m(6)t(6)A37 methyltransferase TsaA